MARDGSRAPRSGHDGRRPRRPSPVRLLVGQVRYQMRLLWRSPMAAFATLVVPIMVLLAINLLYDGTRLGERGGIRYTQFFTPAMVAFAVIAACYMGVVSSVTLAREQGILKRIRSTPLPPSIFMAGRIVAAAVVAFLGAAIVIAVGAGVYGFDVIWHAVPPALLTVAVAVFCFCALGFAVTTLVPTADAALPIAWGTALALCFISDVFQPIDRAPDWLKTIASAFPVRPFADSLERLFNPVTGSTAVDWKHLGFVAAWGVAAAIFAVLAFRWEPSGRSGGGPITRRAIAFLRRRATPEGGGPAGSSGR